MNEHLHWQVTVLLNPCLDPMACRLQFLASCMPLYPRYSLTVSEPIELKAQEREPLSHTWVKTAKAQASGLLWRYLQVEFLQPVWYGSIEPLNINLEAKGAYPIISVSTHKCLSTELRLHPFLKPEVQDIMQVHIRQDW